MTRFASAHPLKYTHTNTSQMCIAQGLTGKYLHTTFLCLYFSFWSSFCSWPSYHSPSRSLHFLSRCFQTTWIFMVNIFLNCEVPLNALAQMLIVQLILFFFAQLKQNIAHSYWAVSKNIGISHVAFMHPNVNTSEILFLLFGFYSH